MSLTDNQQAWLMLGAFALPPVSVWLGLGAPTDRIALSLLGSGVVGGVIAFIKEKLGSGSASAAVSVAA